MNTDATILIIEDSPEDYEACVAALTEDSNIANPIVWCETGDEALDYLRKQGKFSGADHDLPGVILLDLNLPGLDGRDVLAMLKNDPVTRRLPIVVMTSSNDQADIDRCYDAGANSYVVKPVNLDGFLAAIARLRDYWFKIVVLPRPE
ncbi:MAG: response regulator [Paracoccaceae bacterium]|nr:response regulator [Paracoccaceae bacterium]